MSNVEQVLARVDAAEMELTAARSALAAEEEAAYAEAQARSRKVWQDFADGCDPDALSDAVKETGAAYRAAVISGDQPTVALSRYVAAVMREQAFVRLLVKEAPDGVTVRAGINPRSCKWFRDEKGKGLPNGIDGPFVAWLGNGPDVAAVIEHAQATVDAEVQAVKDAAQRAFESVPGAVPHTFRVVAVDHTEDFEDAVAGGGVHFVKGTAYLPADHPALRYYQGHPSYRVNPAWSVPAEYARVAKRAANSGYHLLGRHARDSQAG